MNRDELNKIWNERNKKDERMRKMVEAFKNYSSHYQFSWDMAKHEIIPAERDENGTYYGYKFLKRLDPLLFESPSRPMIWILGRPVESDTMPTEYNRHGIYACKTVEILLMDWEAQYKAKYRTREYLLVAVKIALFGNTVIETEKGFRAHMAQIVEVINEHR